MAVKEAAISKRIVDWSMKHDAKLIFVPSNDGLWLASITVNKKQFNAKSVKKQTLNDLFQKLIKSIEDTEQINTTTH